MHSLPYPSIRAAWVLLVLVAAGMLVAAIVLLFRLQLWGGAQAGATSRVGKPRQ